MKLQPYAGCNCTQCRHAPSKIKQFFRRQDHKKYRHATKRAIQLGLPEPAKITCRRIG